MIWHCLNFDCDETFYLYIFQCFAFTSLLSSFPFSCRLVLYIRPCTFLVLHIYLCVYLNRLDCLCLLARSLSFSPPSLYPICVTLFPFVSTIFLSYSTIPQTEAAHFLAIGHGNEIQSLFLASINIPGAMMPANARRNIYSHSSNAIKYWSWAKKRFAYISAG